MLKILQREPYIIWPKQRYNLSTYEPHNVMNGDFTLFIEFNLDSENYNSEYAIITRPGKNMGIVVKKAQQEYSFLAWDYWTVLDNNHKWNSIQYQLSESEKIHPNDKFFICVQHILNEKKFVVTINSQKLKQPVILEQFYEGTLFDYPETPFNIGCGNFVKSIPEKDKLFTECTIYKLGLIANSEYTYQQIIKFIDNTKNDTSVLSKSLFDIVFYFNFNMSNIYKVWDLSGHCNFLQKNLSVDY